MIEQLIVEKERLKSALDQQIKRNYRSKKAKRTKSSAQQFGK
jgi:hypothetical protein